MPSFCGNCGAPLSSVPGPFCPKCGQPLRGAAGQQPGTQRIQLAQLTVQWPGGRSQSVPLVRDVLNLGRDPGNDIVVDFGTVSRQHARLERRNGTYHVIDLGSRNGTTLNGQRLAPHTPCPLSQGAVLRIGDLAGNSVSLTFNDGTAQPGPVITRQLDLRGLVSAVLGRDPQCSVPLAAPSVSWHHARIDQAAGGAVLRDMGSTNGTFVNGQRVTAHSLRSGDRIQIGPFQLVYQPAALAQVGTGLSYCLEGRNLQREVPDRNKRGATKVILNDVCISIQPGEFVGLVGGSGAGKSTLMTALSGFKRVDAGQVLVNGEDLYQNFALYRTQLGYVPQDDIVHQGLPVAGALRYAARLRLPPDSTGQEISQRIGNVLTRVGMTSQEKQMVSSLSGGQRKRVNIGLELLAEPGLFFLDEPTSGLDPGLEKRMMDTLRLLADEGRTVVLVTHATANITLCDLVGFMAQGRLVFYGPPDEAKRFFQVVEFADIYTLLEPPPTTQTLTPDLAETARQWQMRFQNDPCYRQYCIARQGHGPAAAGVAHSSGPAGRGAPRPSLRTLCRQFTILSQRYLELILRDRMTLIVLLAVMPIVGLLLVLIGQQTDLVGDSAAEIARQLEEKGTYRVVSRAQITLLILGLAAVLLGLFGAAYEVVKEWSIYRRERTVNLGIAPYLASKAVVLMGFALVQCLALLLVLSIKVDLPHDGLIFPAPVEMYITLLLGTLTSIALGLFISALARSQNMVIYVILVLLFLQIIFAGVLFDLPKATQPLSYLTVTRWTMESMGATVDMERLKDLGVNRIEIPADPSTGVPEQVFEVPDKYDFKISYKRTKEHVLTRWAVLLGFTVLWLSLAALVLKRRDEI